MTKQTALKFTTSINMAFSTTFKYFVLIEQEILWNVGDENGGTELNWSRVTSVEHEIWSQATYVFEGESHLALAAR